MYFMFTNIRAKTKGFIWSTNFFNNIIYPKTDFKYVYDKNGRLFPDGYISRDGYIYYIL